MSAPRAEPAESACRPGASKSKTDYKLDGVVRMKRAAYADATAADAARATSA